MKIRRPAAALLLAAGILALPASVRAAGRSLVLIGWDTLRADHVGALGYARKTTPSLDALAAGSALFTGAVSPASWTLPAFMSVFTSLYPTEHGLINKFVRPDAGGELRTARLSTSAVTLSEVLKENGYRTAAFTGGAGVGGGFGFSRGFDVYSDGADFAGFGLTFPQALEWIRKAPEAPYFVFIHGYDTHPYHALPAGGPYAFLDEEEAALLPGLRARHERLRLSLLEGRELSFTPKDVALWTDAYDEKIARADRLLGDFLRELASVGGDEPLLILLSDHGEELFDHGGVDHGMTLYEEMIRVPLLLRVPGGEGKRIGAQVSTLDVFPTILDLLGLKTAPGLKAGLRGRSLAPLLEGAGSAADVYSETDYLFHFSKRALRKAGGLKLVSDGLTNRKEVYDTLRDPAEKLELHEKDPAAAYLLEMQLYDWEEGLEPPR